MPMAAPDSLGRVDSKVPDIENLRGGGGFPLVSSFAKLRTCNCCRLSSRFVGGDWGGGVRGSRSDWINVVFYGLL